MSSTHRQVSFKLTDDKRFQGQLVVAYKKLRPVTLLLDKKWDKKKKYKNEMK